MLNISVLNLFTPFSYCKFLNIKWLDKNIFLKIQHFGYILPICPNILQHFTLPAVCEGVHSPELWKTFDTIIYKKKRSHFDRQKCISMSYFAFPFHIY